MPDLPGAIRIVVALSPCAPSPRVLEMFHDQRSLWRSTLASPVPTSQVPTVIPTAAPTVTSTSTLIPPSPTIASSATSTRTPISPTPVEPSPTRAPATATTAPSVVTRGSAKPAGRGVPAVGRGRARQRTPSRETRAVAALPSGFTTCPAEARTRKLTPKNALPMKPMRRPPVSACAKLNDAIRQALA